MGRKYLKIKVTECLRNHRWEKIFRRRGNQQVGQTHGRWLVSRSRTAQVKYGESTAEREREVRVRAVCCLPVWVGRERESKEEEPIGSQVDRWYQPPRQNSGTRAFVARTVWQRRESEMSLPITASTTRHNGKNKKTRRFTRRGIALSYGGGTSLRVEISKLFFVFFSSIFLFIHLFRFLHDVLVINDTQVIRLLLFHIFIDTTLYDFGLAVFFVI